MSRKEEIYNSNKIPRQAKAAIHTRITSVKLKCKGEGVISDKQKGNANVSGSKVIKVKAIKVLR